MNKLTLKKDTFANIILLVCIIGISFGIILEIVNIVTVNKIKTRVNKTVNGKCAVKQLYWIYPPRLANRNHTLKYLHSVLQTIGYKLSTNRSQWTLLWAVSAFSSLNKNISHLKHNQKANHIPGTEFITNKDLLMTANSNYIPKTFEIPQNVQEFLTYTNNTNNLFIEKDFFGLSLQYVNDIDVSNGMKYVQEYVQNPFLIDGYKFDIGVYVVIMSANPLRVYWYKGDVSLRYCPLKYHPFDPTFIDKYVAREYFVPLWETPSIAHYLALDYSTKESLVIYIKSKGKDPSVMWADIQTALVEILLLKQHHLVEALEHNPDSQDNLFKLIMFDLIVDENLKVYILGAHLAPDLNKAYLNNNGKLYEQVLYSLFSLTGISQKISYSNHMITSNKHIAVFGEQCRTICKDNCTVLELCGLCKFCRDKMLEDSLLKAHSEYLHSGDFRRLFPPVMYPMENINMLLYGIPNNLSPLDRLHYLWYQGKCNQDITWCT